LTICTKFNKTAKLNPIDTKILFFRSLPIEYLFKLPIYARIAFCHIIIIERVCATVFVKYYETEKGRIFTVAWIVIFVIFNLII
jgi:hypothetical protein